MVQTRESFRFVRACDANLRVPAGRCCYAGQRELGKSSSVRSCVPLPCVGCYSLFINSIQYQKSPRCFLLRSRCFSWLPVASRCFPCALSATRVSAPLVQFVPLLRCAPQCGSSRLVAAKHCLSLLTLLKDFRLLRLLVRLLIRS